MTTSAWLQVSGPAAKRQACWHNRLGWGMAELQWGDLSGCSSRGPETEGT